MNFKLNYTYCVFNFEFHQTAADDSHYTGANGSRGNCTIDLQKDGPRVCIDNSAWDELNEFMTTTGAQFVYDMNLRLRNNDNTWNSTNTEELLAYSASKGYTFSALQLGNEVELYNR